MKVRFLIGCLFASLIATGASAQDAGTTEIRRVQWYPDNPQACNVNVPGYGGGNGSYVFYLPPDVPDPVKIETVSIDNEYSWPSDVIVGNGGAWFAAIDPGSTFLSCSHWPGAQDCQMPNTGSQAKPQFSALKVLGMMPIGQQLMNSSNQANYYHRGDAIIIGTPCYTTSGSTSSTVVPNITFGLSFTKYTPQTACSTNTKILLHGGMFENPADRSPLPHFVSDSSPSWRDVGTAPLGGSASNVVIDTATPAALGQPSSIAFDGTTNTGIWLTASGDTVLGGSEWTLDLWFRPKSIDSQFQQLFGWKGYSGFLLAQQGSQLFFSATSNGSSWDLASMPWGSLSLDTWTHIVVQRSGNQMLLSQDGVLKQTIPVTGNLHDQPKSPLYIGNNSSQAYPVTGNMQEVRFSWGARFPGGNYSVPTSPYPCP